MPTDKELLVQVREHDKQVVDLLDVVRKYPEKKAALEKRLKDGQEAVDAAHHAVLDAKKKLAETELELKAKEDQARSLEGKLNSIKKNDEYKLVKDQIAAVGNAASDLETVILGCMDAVERAQAAQKAAQAKKDAADGEVRGTLKDMEESKAYAEDRLAVYESQKKQLLDQVSDIGMVEKYKRLFERYQDQVLVLLKGQNCGGCFLKLTPDVASKVMSGQMLNCPNCGRLMIGPEETN